MGGCEPVASIEEDVSLKANPFEEFEPSAPGSVMVFSGGFLAGIEYFIASIRIKEPQEVILLLSGLMVKLGGIWSGKC